MASVATETLSSAALTLASHQRADGMFLIEIGVVGSLSGIGDLLRPVTADYPLLGVFNPLPEVISMAVSFVNRLDLFGVKILAVVNPHCSFHDVPPVCVDVGCKISYPNKQVKQKKHIK